MLPATLLLLFFKYILQMAFLIEKNAIFTLAYVLLVRILNHSY